MKLGDGHDRIAVVDFGGQYAHLIATKVRTNQVYADIRQPEDSLESFAGYKGIILSGSPSLASFGEDDDWNQAIMDLPVPILGLCFGHQEIAKHYGGKVIHGGREWGKAHLHLLREHKLFAGCDGVEQVWMSHFDSVATVGPEFEELGYTITGTEGKRHSNAVIVSDSLKRYGFQYHPEVDGTLNGNKMIGNFVLDICGCRPSWSLDQFLAQQVDLIRAQVGDNSVFLLASGGVDSTVAAKLFHLALPAGRLKLLHVDNGLMRKDESAKVLQMFHSLGLGDNLHFVDATDDFLAALKGLVAPEAKRHAIGQAFVDVFEREARRLGIEDHLLGQGTIYPDTIETGGTKRSHTIKTHHNRVPIIEQMIADGKVVEPLAELYKVEVRQLGRALAIPDFAIDRHPFPGPGLGVRLLCSNGQGEAPSVADLLSATAGRFGLSAMALPIKSVGVKADVRCYEHPVLISAIDGWNYENVLEATRVILGQVPEINRSLLFLGQGVPKQAKLLEAYMTKERLDLLREADKFVMEGLTSEGLYDAIWQCPTAMLPLEIDGQGREFVVLRPVLSSRAMIAEPAQLPVAFLTDLASKISSLDGVSGVALDLTSKPPGTIEWE